MSREDEMLALLEPLLVAATEGAVSAAHTGSDELSLRSIEVITLVDLLEAELDVHFTSEDVRPETFATRRSIAALLVRKAAQCG